MGFKTILVHVDTGGSASARLKFSAELAARFAAHVTALYVRQPFQAPAFTDAGPAMDSLYRTYENAAKADEATATAAFGELVGGTGLSSDWRVTDGLAEEVVAAHARYVDLVVVGQAEPDSPATTTPADLAETVAISGERPVLIVPHIGVTKPPGKTVLLCWNGTREAARAATGALPILKQADKVILLLIDAKSDGDEQPGANVARWLVRHGVKAVVQRDTAAGSSVGGVILSRAADQDADLIVMGLYGHSRMREWVLGGASRTLLASMTVPLLVAH
ncbi:Nucleotide-binding universal stress protein, UspA family [Rhodospirillales bacterium URHD0017]|nr:Nucleotide-binding universal stress protein, UspA family [Rhodospirillales bacterium URHD0017]